MSITLDVKAFDRRIGLFKKAFAAGDFGAVTHALFIAGSADGKCEQLVVVLKPAAQMSCRTARRRHFSRGFSATSFPIRFCA